ncbi:MAG: tRNA 2-thiocytidine(32) synthetase TtcA, partial [Deltaproteobacteria bacterium]
MSMLEKRLLRDVGRAIADFNLIEAGDRILVGVSGGKDSF